MLQWAKGFLPDSDEDSKMEMSVNLIVTNGQF